MTKKIFRSICSVAVCITLAVLAIILGVLYNYYSDILIYCFVSFL